MRRGLFILVYWWLTHSSALGIPTVADPELVVSSIVTGLSAPTTMAFIAQDDILVLQKNDGRVRRVVGGVLQNSAVLDVNVDNSSERGLLGIAVHPAFPTSPFVYLFFSESSTAGDSSGSPAGNRVYRYTWNGSALTNPVLILDLPVLPGPNHDGGVISFGPDGKLYIVIGDLNRNGQLQNFPAGDAPDDTSVVLRLNDDGSTPADNPFFLQGGNVARYYAYGIRNSFGMAFDPITATLWMTENGPSTYDEINRVEPGFNSGWEQILGPNSRDDENVADLFEIPGSHYGDPEFSWFQTVGPTAMVFLAPADLGSQYQNDAFVGDINNGNLYRFTLNNARDGFVLNQAGLGDLVADNNNELAPLIFGSGFNGITDLKVGLDGRLYVVSFFDGAIYAVSRANAPLAFSTARLPLAEVGVPYNANIAIQGGVQPYDLSLVAGSLPQGLSLSNQTISGTPERREFSFFQLAAVDQSDSSATKRFAIVVLRPVFVRTRSLPEGQAGGPYRARVVAAGGKPPYAWLIIAGALPPGLAFDAASGAIAGRPANSGEFDLTFQVTDALGGTAQRTLTLVIP